MVSTPGVDLEPYKFKFQNSKFVFIVVIQAC